MFFEFQDWTIGIESQRMPFLYLKFLRWDSPSVALLLPASYAVPAAKPQWSQSRDQIAIPEALSPATRKLLEQKLAAAQKNIQGKRTAHFLSAVCTGSYPVMGAQPFLRLRLHSPRMAHLYTLRRRHV
jgi:hypothetical protein